MRPWRRMLAAAVVLVGMAQGVGAGERPAARPFSPAALQQVARQQLAANPRLLQSETRAPKKDSVLNGAAIGAAVGAVAGSFAIVAASGGSDDFPAAMMKVSPLGAGIGALVGVAIDALF